MLAKRFVPSKNQKGAKNVIISIETSASSLVKRNLLRI